MPPVRLTDIQILGKPAAIGVNSPLRQSISMTNSLRFTHKQNIVSLGFSVLSYANPARSRYRYRLEPLETQWNEVDSSQRSVTYPGLPPGDYVFRVLGSNGRGVWNEEGARLAISVLPPWWNSWWFRTVLAALLLFSVWAFLQLRLRQQAHEFNMRLEERVEERTRIARELHDTLLQSFQASLIRMQAARNVFARRPEKAMQTLDDAITTAAGAVAEGRSAIQTLRLDPTSRGDLAELLTAAGQELAHPEGAPENLPAFRMTVEGDRQDLKPLLQDEVYRIALELLRNAFRHAQARRIEAEIRYESRQFRVHVRDDGKGIDPEILKTGGRAGHWGLPGMRERASRSGGKLEFWSEAGAGTEAVLTVPAAGAYAASNGGRFSFLRRKKAAI